MMEAVISSVTESKSPWIIAGDGNMEPEYLPKGAWVQFADAQGVNVQSQCSRQCRCGETLDHVSFVKKYKEDTRS